MFLLPFIAPGPTTFNALTQQFVDSLAPSFPIRHSSWSTPDYWQHAITHPAPPRGLKQVLQAIVLARCGRTSNNHDMILRGRQLYGQTLGLVQQALNDPQLVQADDTLLTVRLMLSYEV